LERSELNKRLPATETAPALCGVLVSAPQAAALSSRSRRHALVFTATLKVNTALSEAPGERFVCHAGEAAPVAAETRRRASANATA
jgi:hypothetical protein